MKSTKFDEKLVSSIVSGVLDRREKFDSFFDNFSEISYDQGEQSFKMIYYMFDRFNNYKMNGGERINIYNTDIRLSKKNYNIDHVNPKKADLYDYANDEDREYINSIGNLLVIPLHSNSKAQNLPISEKVREIYEKYNTKLPTVSDFIKNFNKKDWDSKKNIFSSIEERTRKLAEISFRNVWNITK